MSLRVKFPFKFQDVCDDRDRDRDCGQENQIVFEIFRIKNSKKHPFIRKNPFCLSDYRKNKMDSILYKQ